jgi:hypothetical protein
MTTSTKNATTVGSRPSQSSTLSSDGTTIGWITKGVGPPLLLVHGEPSGRTIHVALAVRTSAGRRTGPDSCHLSSWRRAAGLSPAVMV